MHLDDCLPAGPSASGLLALHRDRFTVVRLCAVSALRALDGLPAFPHVRQHTVMEPADRPAVHVLVHAAQPQHHHGVLGAAQAHAPGRHVRHMAPAVLLILTGARAATCTRSWAHALRDGTPRTRPCKPGTIRRYLRCIHPVLRDWSARYAHLREVTDSDVTAAAGALRGHHRHPVLVALRSLTRHCNKTGLIFADPAARIRAARRPDGLILPLGPGQIHAATEAAVTPAARLALALAAVHAARPETIRNLALGDVDLGNRRITIGGQSRPLDDLTRGLILTWLDHRRARWPDTPSPYLIINQQTAMSTRPVSENWLTTAFRGLDATLERLRIDRQLDEAITSGPDPLHLATVFGIDDTTAIRYATAARQLLDTAAEHHTSG